MGTGAIDPGAGAPPAPALPAPPPEADTPTPSGAAASASGGVRRSVLLLGAAIGAVALVAVLVVALTSRQPAAYAEGSPEASFQAYLQAWEARDLDTAYASFSDALRSRISREQYRSMANDYGWVRAEDRRVVLVASRVNGDNATLELRVDQFSNGMGGGGVRSSETTVPLVREGGVWHVDQLLAGLEPMWYEK